MAVKSAFSTLLLLHSQCQLSSSLLYCEVDLFCALWMGRSFNNLVYFMHQNCSHDINIKLAYFYAF